MFQLREYYAHIEKGDELLQIGPYQVVPGIGDPKRALKEARLQAELVGGTVTAFWMKGGERLPANGY